MSLYQNIAAFGKKFIPEHILFKHGFNLSPMYRRSTARIISVSPDLKHIQVKLPISYKNRNYVNSIFGGSLFSAVDPIPMVQLINIIGPDYVVWDKAAQIRFKRPAREDVFASFEYTAAELETIRSRVAAEQEIEIVKTTQLQNKAGTQLFCEVDKTIYIADKKFFKEKQRRRAKRKKAED